MHLSEIKGEQAIEVMANMIGPIANLAADNEFMGIFKPSDTEGGANAREAALQRLTKAIPALLVTHKADFVQLLAAVNLADPDEYAEGLTVPKLLHDVVELLTDKELLAFFG